MSVHHFLAFDLGAESGRALLGTLDGKRISVREIHRFPNAPIQIAGHLHWNLYGMFEEIKKTLRLFSSGSFPRPESLGVDTWGVDFGLLGRDGVVLGLPYSYRDSRTTGAVEAYSKLVPKEKLYELTGIQFLPFNSLIQVFALARDRSPLLEIATDLLFMPDLFNYLLTGIKATEFTIASTSQILNPRTGAWNRELLDVMGISPKILQRILNPGTILGNLLQDISEEVGVEGVPVVATAGHDTGAAVAAVPAEGEDWAYLSSGTWSLIGVELPSPIITAESRDMNFTNEGGIEGTIRFLKNVTGLWLVRQCRKAWAKDKPLTYEELARMAESAPPGRAFIDPDAPDFLNPPDMPRAISNFCLRTGQPPPAAQGEFMRCILESLALKYRHVLDRLARLISRPIRKIHIIGGGSQNRLLCRFTADAAGIPVVTGPAEATSVGNILVQALALGYVSGRSEIREIVRNSFDLELYEPGAAAHWDEAYKRFASLLHS